MNDIPLNSRRHAVHTPQNEFSFVNDKSDLNLLGDNMESQIFERRVLHQKTLTLNNNLKQDVYLASVNSSAGDQIQNGAQKVLMDQKNGLQIDRESSDWIDEIHIDDQQSNEQNQSNHRKEFLHDENIDQYLGIEGSPQGQQESSKQWQQHLITDFDDEPAPLRLNTLVPLMIRSVSGFSPEMHDNLRTQLKIPSLKVSGVLDQTKFKEGEDETNNRPRVQESKAKATEAYTRAEKEIRKYDISIDQFKQRQWVKNPIPSWNLLVVSAIYITIICIAIPLAVNGIEANSCNLELHFNYHVIFLFVSLATLIPTDLYAYLNNQRILSILSQQSPFYQSHLEPSELTFCSLLGNLIVFMLNILCSTCQLYELYSDILIALVSLFNTLSITFGFFAVILPIVNRFMQIYACWKMFTYGMKMRVKTISTEKQDKLLIYLSLYNTSRLMFPHFHDHKPKWLTLIIIKECVFKLMQIILKLVLITPTLSDTCSGNVSTLSFMIVANLMSALQMVFYITQKYPKKQEEIEFMNLNELNEYYDINTQTFKAVIISSNQDKIMKKINAFVFQPRCITRSIHISFRNPQLLIQLRYRDQFLQMLSKYQQFNFKLRELKIYDSTLNFVDFKNVSQIISLIPKLETLILDNIVIKSGEGESECIGQLKYGIERNKNFQNLILRFQTVNKEKLYEHFRSMYNLNQQLSIQFINQCQLPRSLDNYAQITQQSMLIPDESLIYSLYDEIDLNLFVECRKAEKNHKLFLFRDWENLLRRLFLVKSKNLNLSDLPNLSSNQTTLYKKQAEMFVFWVQFLIQKNQQLSILSLRLNFDENKNETGNKLSLNLSQAETIIDEFLENQQNNLKTISLIGYDGPMKLQESFFGKVLKLNLITEIKLENCDLSNLKIFKLFSEAFPQLNSVHLKNNNLSNLENIYRNTNLTYICIEENQIVVKDQEIYDFIIRQIEYLDISNQIFEPFDFENLSIESKVGPENDQENKLTMLSLRNNDLSDDYVCRFVLEMAYKFPQLSRLNLEGNQLTDLSIPFIEKYLTCRKWPLDIFNLNKNHFSTKSRRLLKVNKVISLSLNENCIKAGQFFDGTSSILPNDSIISSLSLSKQESPKTIELKMLDIKPFRWLTCLELGYIGLMEFPVQLIIQQITECQIPVHHLDLSGNNVGHLGCKSLNILAQRNKTLKSLILDSANIKCIGLSYLWLGFSDQDDDLYLEQLSVKGNNIDAGWARRLNYKICQPLKVKRVNLSDNLLGDKASKQLMTYFESNKFIETLDLSNNGMTREGLRHIKELIYRNTYIKELIVKGNKDIDESVEMCERRARASETSQKIIYD